MTKPLAYGQERIKEARLAGTWYPGSRAELSSMIDGFMAGVPEEALLPGADIGLLVSPHAGYVFSGPVAACGFKAAARKKVATVIILAPSHHAAFKGAAVWPDGAFTTPLGKVDVDADLAQKIMAKDSLFTVRRDVFEGKADRPENSVETQIPFIQRVFPTARIVPVILGFPPDAATVTAVADALVEAVGGRDDVLVVVSVDQSHFHPLAEAEKIDRAGLTAIEAFDIEGLWNGHAEGRMEVDGFHVVTAGMLYAKKSGYDRGKVLRYATSADTSGDRKRVVGYASIALFKATEAPAPAGTLPLTASQKARLLKIARQTVDAFVTSGRLPDFDEKDARLAAPEGAFVTLKKKGVLRGCIGNIIGQGPLFRTVQDMAVAAASEDPRFAPVTADELKEIHVEVSVLSAPRVVRSADEVEMGKHGVIVRKGGRGGVFLPQVAAETGWSREEFLGELCSQKAGLPRDCWKDPATKIEVFTADVFGEKE